MVQRRVKVIVISGEDESNRSTQEFEATGNTLADLLEVAGRKLATAINDVQRGTHHEPVEPHHKGEPIGVTSLDEQRRAREVQATQRDAKKAAAQGHSKGHVIVRH